MLAALGSSNDEVVVYEPVIDTIPPVIDLLGEPPEHVRAFDSNGNIMIITTHETGTPYMDAGAFARDVVDGVLPAELSLSVYHSASDVLCCLHFIASV